MKSNDKKFTSQNYYIGIDVHKKSWTVTILSDEHEIKSFSQNPDPLLLRNNLDRLCPEGVFHTVYETGFCGFEPHRKLTKFGIDSILVHPPDIPTTHKDKKRKTDKNDSRRLAHALRAGVLRPIHVPSRELEADRDLMRQRDNFVKQLASFKNRVKSLLMKISISIPEQFENGSSRVYTKEFISWLENIPNLQASHRKTIDNYIEYILQQKTLIKKTEEQLKEIEAERYAEDCAILRTVPGFGQRNALNFRLQWGDITRFKRLDELASYTGIVPNIYASGENERIGRMTKRGRGNLKSSLIEACWVAIRFDPELRKRYNVNKNKIGKNKAIVKIAKNILSRARTLLINKECYQVNMQ